jgi:tetratricopeptide (TPR) repeat protein
MGNSDSKVSVAGQFVPGVSAVERAQNACAEAKRLEKIGEYQAASEVVAEFWPDRQAFPVIPGDLPEEVRAELLLRIGALACWLGGSSEIKGNQELGKDIISRALDSFEGLGLLGKVAEARGDLGLCYWREGAFDEARIQYQAALKAVPDDESDLRAILLVRAGIVEVYAHRLNTALSFFNEAFPLVEESSDEALKGGFHFSYALLFKRLAAPENREDYIDRALVEYTAASFHFEQAGNVRAQARVENNLGNLFCLIKRYPDAHKHLDRARTLFLELGDVSTISQVDETRARVFVGEGRLVEAEKRIKMAVKALESGDQHAVLAEALTTYGVIVARLGFQEKARIIFERAIHVAQTIGDTGGVGRALLSTIEELRLKMPASESVSICLQAMDLLKKTEDSVISSRLIGVAGDLLEMLSADQSESGEPDTFEGFSFKKYLLDAERRVISRALREAGGSVTKAAKLLGFNHHQSLISLLNGRHKELLNRRSTIRRRGRSLITGPGAQKVKRADDSLEAKQRIMYVGDSITLGKLVGGSPSLGSVHVEAFSSLFSAAKGLAAGRYGVIVLGPGFEKLEVLKFVDTVMESSAGGRVSVVVSGPEEWEAELWQSKVEAFVAESDGPEELSSALVRVLAEDNE